MKIKEHTQGSFQIARVTEINVNSTDEGLDLLGTIYFQGFNAVILDAECFHPYFFDLSTGMAGEILQKFSNYRMKLAIVGLPETTLGRSHKEFIRESNKLGQVMFCNELHVALERLR